jgi:hypothetical protein
MEQYKNEKYPKLKSYIYTNNNHDLTNNNKYDSNILKFSNNEQELKNRTKKPTLKELFRDKLEKILDSATSYKNLLNRLQ